MDEVVQEESSTDPQYRPIVVIDLVGSSRWNDRTQLRARAELQEMVEAAFRVANVDRRGLVMEDRGDGMIMLISATVSKVRLLDPMVPCLTISLEEHNRTAYPRLRVRMAMHAGEVIRGKYGWIGSDLNLACRLANSPSLYRELRACPRTHLVLIVSDVIHQAVVRHGHRNINPASYTPVHVAVKEVNTRAWLHNPCRQLTPSLEFAPGCLEEFARRTRTHLEVAAENSSPCRTPRRRILLRSLSGKPADTT